MKIAVITGASSGMGKEAAYQIADRFSGIQEIWLIARRKERLDAMEEILPVRIRTFGLDLCREADLETLSQALASEKPDVKFLVNAAGFGKIGSVSQLNVLDQCGMVALNCQALCAVTAMVLPYMSDNSRILQFASAAAFLPQPGFSVYAATKSFVLSYSRALNQELKAREISVTAVCPGPVKTEFFEIAETTGKAPAYKNLFMAKPRRVVEQAIRDSMMGKELSIYGISMKLFYGITKILPHRLILWGMTQATGQKKEAKQDV